MGARWGVDPKRDAGSPERGWGIVNIQDVRLVLGQDVRWFRRSRLGFLQAYLARGGGAFPQRVPSPLFMTPLRTPGAGHLEVYRL